MTDGNFSIEDLAQTIRDMLGLSPGDDVEIQRSRLEPDRLMIIKHGQGPAK